MTMASRCDIHPFLFLLFSLILFLFRTNPVWGETRIVLLGTGTPNADPDRAGPAVAVIVDGTPYLVDCGTGIVRRAAAAEQKGIPGLDPKNLKTVFITHLHSDHTLGYADLILTPWVLDREEPLEAYGPPGLKRMTDHILQAYQEDIQNRIHGLQPIGPDGWRVNVHEIEPGIIYSDHNITVKAFPVSHGAWEHAFGFRFETPDKIVVVSGDRNPEIDIAEHCIDCDILVHEVYSSEGFLRRSEDWQAYHSASHTSSHELAELANRVKPRMIILIHQLLWGAAPEELLEEIRQSYDGNVVYGRDLDIF